VQGIRTYAQTVGLAIGEALAVIPDADRWMGAAKPEGPHAIVALCAEQGFAGAFSEHVLDSVEGLVASEDDVILVVGDRGLMLAEDRGLKVNWSAPMIVNAAQSASLADRIVDELFARIAAGTITHVSLVHADARVSDSGPVQVRRLVPFDFDRFPAARTTQPALMTLPPLTLLSRLAEEYVFAEICEAVALSFAAENAARMRATVAAKENVDETMDKLVARSRQVRQEEITEEILELATAGLD